MRLVRKIEHNFKVDCHFQTSAIVALQHAAEDYLLHHFEMTLLSALHRNVVTIMKKD